MTLQAKLEQILNDYSAEVADQFGGDTDKNPVVQSELEEALQAILATVSKHLPKKVEAPLDCCDNEGGAICWKETKVNARNTAIAEMEKTLGADHE